MTITISRHERIRRPLVATLTRLPVIPDRRASRWSWWLIPIVAVGVLLPLTVAALTGNLAIPHNDSWAASKIAETFATTGKIELVNWNQMSMIGQVVMLGPLGSSIVNQQLAVAILSIVLLYCAYDLVSPSLTTGRAAYATLLVAIWPGFALLATSFMTDIPEITAAFASLALGRRALTRDSPRLLYLAMLIGFWGTTIREEAILAPIAFIAYGLIRQDERTKLARKRLLVASGAFVALFLVFYVWRSGLAEANNPPFITGSVGAVLLRIKTDTPELYFTLAFGISPAVVATARPWRWTRGSWLAASLIALLACAIGLGPHVTDLLSGNYLTANGAYPQVLGAAGSSRKVFGVATMMIVDDVAGISGILLAGTLLERWRWHHVEPLLAIFTAMSIVAVALFAWMGLGLYDRYLVVLIPGVLAAVLARPTVAMEAEVLHTRQHQKRRYAVLGRTQMGLAALAAIFVFAMSALTAANAFSFDIARWHFAEQLVRTTGVPAAEIDAGLEWLGMHIDKPVKTSPGHLLNQVNFEGLWQRRPTCINLSPTPASYRTHWVQVGTYHYRTFLVGGASSELYASYTDQRGNPQLHATGCPKLK